MIRWTVLVALLLLSGCGPADEPTFTLEAHPRTAATFEQITFAATGGPAEPLAFLWRLDDEPLHITAEGALTHWFPTAGRRDVSVEVVPTSCAGQSGSAAAILLCHAQFSQPARASLTIAIVPSRQEDGITRDARWSGATEGGPLGPSSLKPQGHFSAFECRPARAPQAVDLLFWRARFMSGPPDARTRDSRVGRCPSETITI